MQNKNTYYVVALVVVVIIIIIASVSGKKSKPVAEVVVNTSTTTTTVVTTVTTKADGTATTQTKTQTVPTPTPTPKPPVTLSRSPVLVQNIPVYYSPTSTVAQQIHVYNPTTNTSIYPPLSVSGEAVGGWYFEGSFPVVLTNAQGTVIAQGQARALSSWQTPGFVPFSATLSFPRQPSSSKGALILRKDNPSGLPANDASVHILVTFQ